MLELINSVLIVLVTSAAASPLVWPSGLVLAVEFLLRRPGWTTRYGVLVRIGMALHVIGAAGSAGTTLWLIAKMKECSPCASGFALLLVAVPAWLLAVAAQILVFVGRRR